MLEVSEKDVKVPEKKEDDFDKKSFWFFGGMLVIGAICILIYLAMTGNEPQVFYDIINEYTAKIGSNKSAERALFYIFSILGALAYALFYFHYQKKTGIANDNVVTGIRDNKSYVYVILGLLIFTGVYCFVYSGMHHLLIAGMMMAIILYTMDQTLMIPGMAFFFVSAYAVCGLYRIYVFMGGKSDLCMMLVTFISILSSLVLLGVSKANRRQSLLRGILVAQLIVPFSLLVYLSSTYQYDTEYITIEIPAKIKILIGFLVLLFVIEAVFKIYKKWNSPANVGEIVTYGVCIAIMSFNRYSGTGSIIPSDMHHPYENIIGFSQIFELGQKAFSQYIPVSGMYSVIHGFFLSFFGHGQFSFYYLTTNLFFLMAIVLIVFLLKQQMKGEWVLLISLIFMVNDYDRVTFIVPIMLLLVWPKLIEKKNLWLKVWFLSGFLHGLYYPIFGAAVCLGFMPLGIWQIVTYVRSKKFKKDIRKKSFWVWWILCCIPVGLGSRLLLGTVKHMKAMGDQTVCADGISRFGQVIPDDFLSYLQSMPVRLIIYYLFSFLILISLVWISVVLCLRIGKVTIEDRHIKIANPIPAFISLSFGIVLLVSFLYTVVRLDVGNIYARSEGVVYAAFVMLIIIISRYMKGMKKRFWVYGIAVFAIAAVTGEGFAAMESNEKLSAYYTVPDNYVYVSDDNVEKLGEGFVEEKLYNSIETAYESAEKMDKEKTYLGVFDDFGFYYLCNLKGDSVIESSRTIKGYQAARETVDLIRKNHTTVGSKISTVSNYYFYYWLINSGEYVWDSENRVFVPNDGSVSREEILEQNKDIDVLKDDIMLYNTAGSWGKSMDTLQDIFDDPEIGLTAEGGGTSVNINFEQAINGNDADFMYMEFAQQDQNCQYILYNLTDNIPQDTDRYWYIKNLMKKDYNPDILVRVSWDDEAGNGHHMYCKMDQGKLLIPLGGGQGWLLNRHGGITISVICNDQFIDVPTINVIKMLKVREIQ